ncbi:MAG: DNRLRE domain-containing protein [Algibacter sp.]
MKKSIVIAFILLGLIISCSEDEETTITISNFEVTIDENPSTKQVLGTIDANTNQGYLTFSIIEQSTNDAFQINATTGELTVLIENLFDFETYPKITGTVKVLNGNVSETANITINLNDVDETTVTISDFEVTINENPSSNQVLGTIDANTNQGNLTFSITEQSTNDAFQINATTGELIVLTESLFDFETYPKITGTVKVLNGNVSETANITINLNDVDENIIEITNIFDTNIEGIVPQYSWTVTPDINFENFEDSSLIMTHSYESIVDGDMHCFASRGLLDFDLTSLSTNNINIINVQLVLHKANVTYCPPCGPDDNQNTQLYFQLIDSFWNVGTANWENQPSTVTDQSINLHILSIENINNFDITDLFLELYNNQNIYQGLMINITESCIQESVSFFSSNYSDTNKRPKLIIQYN